MGAKNPPGGGLWRVELGGNGRQRRVGQFLHRSERMIGRNPGFDREIVMPKMGASQEKHLYPVIRASRFGIVLIRDT